MKALITLVGGLLIALPAFPREPLIQMAPAGQYTMRLATESKENDPLHQAAKRAAADPHPDASTYALLASVHTQDEHKWQQAFSRDMEQAFRQDAMTISVPFEHPPSYTQDGFGIVQLLANAVLRARLPCASIYTVDSLLNDRGWILVCDQRTNAYTIMLVDRNWKLNVITPRSLQWRTKNGK